MPEDSCMNLIADYRGIDGWKQALEEGYNSSFATHVDWRVPNIKELASIVNYTKKLPAISNDIFPNTKSKSYWSSTPDDGGQYIHIVSFSNGKMNLYRHSWSSNVYARLVRDIPDSGN